MFFFLKNSWNSSKYEQYNDAVMEKLEAPQNDDNQKKVSRSNSQKTHQKLIVRSNHFCWFAYDNLLIEIPDCKLLHRYICVGYMDLINLWPDFVVDILFYIIFFFYLIWFWLSLEISRWQMMNKMTWFEWVGQTLIRKCVTRVLCSRKFV